MDIRTALEACGVDVGRWAHFYHQGVTPPQGELLPADFLPRTQIGQLVAHLANVGGLPRDWRVEPVSVGDDSLPQLGYFIPRHSGGAPAWLVRAYYDDDEPCDGWWWALVPDPIIYYAAATSCRDAALRGECPGVDPEAFAEFLAAERGKP